MLRKKSPASLFSICISLIQLSNGIAKEINCFNVLVSSHTASLSLMELEIVLNSKAVSPNLWHIVKEEIYTSVEQDSMVIERRHCQGPA